MTKKYYEILEVSETATSEEIKKAYRKLALKWHPDKNGDSEKSKIKFQEIGEAYGVLINEELRKRYDVGETNFSENHYDIFSEYEEAISSYEEEIRREREQMEALKELITFIEKQKELTEKIWLINAKYLDRAKTWNEISAAMAFNFPRVFPKDLEAEGYSKLWEPYENYLDKVQKMEITVSEEKEESDELKNFKEEMFKAIKETGIILETKKKAKEKARNDHWLEKEKNAAIEVIEEQMKRERVKVKDLEEYSEYKEQINNLDKKYKIRDLRDKIIVIVRAKADNRNDKTKENNRRGDKTDNEPINNAPTSQSNPQEQEKQTPNESKDNNRRINYNDLTKEELIKVVEEKDFKNSYLQEIISALEKKTKELEEEIIELKDERPQNSEIKQAIQKRETLLQETKASLSKLRNANSNITTKPKNSKLPTKLLIIGGAIIFAVFTFFIILIRRKRLKKR